LRKRQVLIETELICVTSLKIDYGDYC
jgi:hypothetical protein